jgi:predicted GH43/DUF377 family glycosyl hydrolase
MMHWKKHGLVYSPDGSLPWAVSHAMIPTPVRIDEWRIRVFITACDTAGIGRPGYVDVSASDPTRVLSIGKKPLIEIGEPGTFDENGVLACSVINAGGGKMQMYYVGFELGTKIRYRLLTGLALSDDQGETFTRVKKTPVLERSDCELYFRCGPCCIKDSRGFKMWYVGGDRWIDVMGKQMPVYDIRYIESEDGITWPDRGEVQISITQGDEHGFGRPYVIPKPQGGYRLFYSVRRISYGAYRMGYAESDDGRNWVRMDDKINLDVSPGEFDSDAIMYAAPIQIGERLFVFYNGNDFGREGFGVAELINT